MNCMKKYNFNIKYVQKKTIELLLKLKKCKTNKNCCIYKILKAIILEFVVTSDLVRSAK